MTKDIRWKQRFQHFESSFQYLEQAMKVENPDIIHKAGLIHFFEMSIELAWKTLKDYLEEHGFIDVNTPRKCIKKAFEIELISDGNSWLKALEDRNFTTHTYDEANANEAIMLLHDEYFPLLKELYILMKQKENE